MIIFILSNILGGGNGVPSGTPPVVIVTVLDPDNYSKEYLNNIKENRLEYASKHGKGSLMRVMRGELLTHSGYTTFFPTVSDYELDGAPDSWSKVPAIRHALTKFPFSTYVWYLDQNSLIMNPEITIEGDIMSPKKLESLMIKDKPVVPPDSVIKTFPHLKGANIDFVLTQDKEGLAQGSFIVRKGDWGKFFLDTWFDPLYRSYNFQKADTHALVSAVAVNSAIETDNCPGTYCTMAPYNPLKTCTGPPTNHEFIQQRRICN